MAARPLDIAPAGPVTLPDAGLGRGWEPTAVVLLTLLAVKPSGFFAKTVTA